MVRLSHCVVSQRRIPSSVLYKWMLERSASDGGRTAGLHACRLQQNTQMEKCASRVVYRSMEAGFGTRRETTLCERMHKTFAVVLRKLRSLVPDHGIALLWVRHLNAGKRRWKARSNRSVAERMTRQPLSPPHEPPANPSPTDLLLRNNTKQQQDQHQRERPLQVSARGSVQQQHPPTLAVEGLPVALPTARAVPYVGIPIDDSEALLSPSPPPPPTPGNGQTRAASRDHGDVGDGVGADFAGAERAARARAREDNLAFFERKG